MSFSAMPPGDKVSYRRDGVESVHYRRSPAEFIRTVLRHRSLLSELVRRDVAGRYRDSMLGLMWSFINPLVMLAAYTVVFGVFLQTKWPGVENTLEFSVVLFAGLILFSFVAECLNRAPALVVTQPSYVKKVVFPLELFPWMVVSTALFHAAVSTIVWCVFHLVAFGRLDWTVALLPLVFMPLILITLGFTFLLAGIGVYIRDVGQIITIALQLLMFLSPVFYSIDRIPAPYRTFLAVNPLAFLIEQARDVMLARGPLDIPGMLAMTAGAFVFAWLGFVWFQHVREGFADVL
jgi:lipopolysaccharide transport system permease protein